MEKSPQLLKPWSGEGDSSFSGALSPTSDPGSTIFSGSWSGTSIPAPHHYQVDCLRGSSSFPFLDLCSLFIFLLPLPTKDP